jgi:uncharacterized protein
MTSSIKNTSFGDNNPHSEDNLTKMRVFNVGDPADRTLLGLSYIHEASNQRDYDMARGMFEIAASENNAHALHCLGVMHDIGHGVQVDKEEAARWFSLSAKHGFIDAQYRIGMIYLNGDGIQPNYKEALYWLKMAADQGDVNSQYSLGFVYRDGRGVRKDNVLTYMWWNLAAEQQDKYALNNREVIAMEMTDEEITEAIRLTKEWTYERPNLNN